MSDQRNKVYGPFEIIGEGSPEGRVIQALPWVNVRGAQVLASCTDNFGQLQPNTGNATYWAIAEVTIWGVVQGYANVLKRQQIRMSSGPMTYVLPDEEAYDQVEFRARNFTGGKRAVPSSTGSNAPVQANGFSLKVQLFIQPRGGFTR